MERSEIGQWLDEMEGRDMVAIFQVDNRLTSNGRRYYVRKLDSETRRIIAVYPANESDWYTAPKDAQILRASLVRESS